MGRQLFISHSSMGAFRKCPRYYWYKHIRRLELAELTIPFIIGRIMHHGIQTLFSKPDDAEKETKKKFKEEATKARTLFPQISPDDEEELAGLEFSSMGMLKAFRRHYGKFLKGTQHVKTEARIQYELNKKVVVVGNIDNIIMNQNTRYMYELKNLKSFDMRRIEGIKTDAQTSLYFTLWNRMVKKSEKLGGIIYNLIRKPSIRQKKGESRGEFLRRLEEWYEEDTGLKFHMDRIKVPLIPGEHVINSIEKVSNIMLSCKTKEDYYQDFGSCIRDWGRCPMYALCHEGGETKANLKLYKIRPKHVVKEEGGEDGDE